MKIINLLFAAFATIILFINNAGGPVNVQQIGYTGSPIDQSATCNSCHSSGNYDASASLSVLNAAGTAVVTKYELGQEYTIRLTISVGTGTPVGYGFQMIDLRESNNVNVKGFLPTAQQANNISVNKITSTGNVYAEHSSRISSKVINVKWKAPSTNLGTIVFYAAANAVNGNGDITGDSPTSGTSIQLPASTTRTNELSENINIQISPNPTPSNISVTLNSKFSKSLKLQMTDMTGRVVLSENWYVLAGENQRLFDIETVAKGAYMIQIIDNQDIISKKLFKL